MTCDLNAPAAMGFRLSRFRDRQRHQPIRRLRERVGRCSTFGGARGSRDVLSGKNGLRLSELPGGHPSSVGEAGPPVNRGIPEVQHQWFGRHGLLRPRDRAAPAPVIHDRSASRLSRQAGRAKEHPLVPNRCPHRKHPDFRAKPASAPRISVRWAQPPRRPRRGSAAARPR
jgi:hypothetical protein